MKFELANRKMRLSADGLDDFYWPISRSEQSAYRDALLGGMVAVARARGDDMDLERDLFSSVCQLLVREGLALFYILALERRARRDGHDIGWPDDAEPYADIVAGRGPDVDASLAARQLWSGHAAYTSWRRLASTLKHDLRLNGVGWRAVRPIDYRRDIVACHTTVVLEEHAACVPDAVKYVVFDDWFPPITPSEFTDRPVPAAIRDEAVAALRDAFAAANEPLPDAFAARFAALTKRITALARVHIDRLLAAPERLPRRLWTGTGAYIWTRMIRHAVRRRGGHVTGHEHGTGECIINHFNTKTFSDLESADRFVTFNSNQRRWLEEMVDERLLVPRERPEIAVPDYPEGLVRYAGRPPAGEPIVRPAGAPLRVMYVGPIYCGLQPRLSHHNADPVIVDWQARLIGRLKSWGCDVLLKPHPEGEQRPPEAFVRELGARVVNGPFEQVWHEADVFLFDWKTTTAFSTAIVTGLPLVMVDFGFETFSPEMDRLVNSHCRVVRGRTDEANRLHVDWQELEAAVTRTDTCDTSPVREAAFRFA